MAEYEIVHEQADKTGRRYPVTESGLVIGRSPDVNINLTDQLVSRRHARVWMEEGAPVVEDLGSRNGVMVNGRKVQRAVLHEGDEILVGEGSFRIAQIPGSRVGQAVISQEKADVLHASIISESSGSRLPVLYRAAQLLGSVFDLDDLLEQLLGVIFEALPVRRGFILTLSPDSAEPVINAKRSLDGQEAAPPLSSTMLQHVYDHKEAMLTLDAQDDSRFDLADSIMSHEIHSAMCAPLRGRQDVVGAIYVDSGAESTRFKSADLELLTAIAWVAGVAVENARLYRENVERERMAAIGEATAGLGHCIKNILTGIRGGGDIITRALQERNIDYVEKGWSILSRSVDRIDILVMNMLTYSKERQPQREETDLNQMVREVIEALRVRAERAQVTVEFLPENTGMARVDGPQIYRVILNLVINAVEACESNHGQVTVSTAYEPEGWRMTVADTGAGIAPEIRPRLFQAFVSNKGSSGTGLGLACTHKIVQEHGGQIAVESAPGSGSTFTVFLPQCPEPDETSRGRALGH
jgi:signal transduction histidine kinase